MPNIKSAKKRVIISKKKNDLNKSARTELKTVLKKARAEGADSSVLLNAVKKIDKAVSKGLVHKNKAARIKSRLAKKQTSA